MKKSLSLILISFLTFSVFTNLSQASEKTVYVKDLELSLSIPDSYLLIEADTPEDALVFDKLGVSGREFLAQLKAGNIYLNCISPDCSEEIVVTMVPNSIEDFNLLSDTTLKTLAGGLSNRYKAFHVDVLKYDMCQQNQARFVRVYYYDNTQSVYGLQYYTVFDHKAMNFTMRSYGAAISTKQENTIEAVVDSIQFGVNAQEPNDNTPSSKFKVKPSENKFVIKDNAGNVYTTDYNWGNSNCATVPTNPEDNAESIIWVFLIIAIVVVCAVVVIILFWKKAKPKKHPIEDEQTKNEVFVNNNSERAFSSMNDYCFCHKCGTRLNADAQFCHKCGAKIEKKDNSIS